MYLVQKKPYKGRGKWTTVTEFDNWEDAKVFCMKNNREKPEYNWRVQPWGSGKTK